jgi:hypothetical protein
MVVEKIIPLAKTMVKRIDGKWVEVAVDSTLPKSKALIKPEFRAKLARSASAVTTPTIREVAHTRLPEGMLPEEMSMVDIRRLFSDRYKTMRYGDKSIIRKATPEQANRFHSAIKSQSKGILIDDEVDWIYRKPSSITDRIQSFKVIPKERISMNINADPELVSALDRYIANGEVIVNGTVIKTVKPPQAYYKIDTGLDETGSFWTRTDPITMYFREPATTEQLSDIVQITRQYSCSTPVTFPSSTLKGASWLSHAKEHSPEDLYQLYKRALRIDPKLAEAIEVKVTKSGYGRLAGVDYGAGLPYIERYRFRMSEGQYQAIESVVNDFEKALGKTGFDRMM